MKTVFVQNWEESERGWGTRPDGFTVHIDRSQCDRYVSWYNRAFNNLPEAPSEYTRTSGEPVEIEVDEALFNKIERATKKKRGDGTLRDAVHGVGKSFSTSPMRSLKEEDIVWPSPR